MKKIILRPRHNPPLRHCEARIIGSDKGYPLKQSNSHLQKIGLCSGLILAVCFLFIVQIFAKSLVFADEIIDSKGNITPCKIETVADGFIEYEKNGNLYSFQREKDQFVFNDYVDVRLKLLEKEAVTRYSGKIIVKDSDGLRIRNENGDMDIPWYRIKFVGIYKP